MRLKCKSVFWPIGGVGVARALDSLTTIALPGASHSCVRQSVMNVASELMSLGALNTENLRISLRKIHFSKVYCQCAF